MTSYLYRAGKNRKWPELTDEERERMRVDYSPEAVTRRAGLLIVSKGSHEKAMEFAKGCLDAFWPNSPGYVFWTRVHACIAVHQEEARQAAAPDSHAPAQAEDGHCSPIAAATAEDELPGPDDLSDAARLRWARALVAKFGEDDANQRVKAFRAEYEPGSPMASFWSRVQVEILAPRRTSDGASADPSTPNRAVLPAEADPARTAEPRGTDGSAEPPAAAAPAEPSDPNRASSLQGTTEGGELVTPGADGSAGAPRPWRDPDVVQTHKPNNPAPPDPAQGRLF